MIDVRSHAERPIDPAHVRSLYDDANWWPDRSVSDIAAVLDEMCFGAWDGDRLVGFLRIVSDGRLRAFVEDVVVASDVRRTGVASTLLDDAVAAAGDVETVSLFCAPELEPLYAEAGFEANQRDVVMHRRRS